MNFKKIASIAASVLMAGMSMGLASAAAFPAPFVQNGSANAAIVYGSSAAQTDFAAASNIAASLANGVTPTGTTNISGENVALQRPSSFLHVGGYLGDVFGRSITSSDMPTLLADHSFTDSANADHKYTQKVDVANVSLSQFDLSGYSNGNVTDTTPTIGVPITADDQLLNYTLTFQDNVNMSKMANENLNIMGKDYYILSASNTSSATMTLLDSGASTSLDSGKSSTLTVGGKTYSVTATYVDTSQVRLTVNGEETNMLKAGETYKLSDGSYIGIKDVYSNGAPSGAYQAGVTFSIGSGKITLTDGQNVKVNDNSINDLTSTFTIQSGKLNKLMLTWAPNDDVAITSTGLTMPVFNSVKFSFSGMTYPSTELTQIKSDSNNAVELSTKITNGPVSFDILANNNEQKNFTMIGKDSTHLLETNASGVLNYDGSHSGNSFIASWKNGKDAESYMLTVDGFGYDTDGTTPVATVKSNNDGGSLNQQVRTGDSITLGNIVLDVSSVNKTAKTITFTGNSGVTFNHVYTADGLQILLPTATNQTDTNGGIYTWDSGTNTSLAKTSYPIQFTEENKDGTIAGGTAFNITVTSDSNYRTTVGGVSNTAGTGLEEGSSNLYQYTVPSALATNIEWDKSSSSQQTADITYHGGESYGTLYLASGSATVSNGAGSLGNIIYKDSEVSSITADNVIIVGGSCINSAAATVLGVSAHTCGDAFTQATKVGAGQYLIEGFNNPGLGNAKYALVVAGYSAADTTNAATYLTMKNPDTSQAWIGTSATEATQQVVSK